MCSSCMEIGDATGIPAPDCGCSDGALLPDDGSDVCGRDPRLPDANKTFVCDGCGHG